MVNFIAQPRPQVRGTQINFQPLGNAIANAARTRATQNALSRAAQQLQAGESQESVALDLAGSGIAPVQQFGLQRFGQIKQQDEAREAREAQVTREAERFKAQQSLAGERVAIARSAEKRAQAKADREEALFKSFQSGGGEEGDPGAGNIDTSNLTPGERAALNFAVNKGDARTIAKITGAAEARTKRTKQKNTAATVVIQDIDRGLGIINESPSLTTGLGGQILSNIGGTAARDLDGIITTIKANAGFDRLQAMREASPTGGALGQVSNTELAQLNAAIGSLEQSQSDAQLKDNMRRVKNLYLDAIHGEGNGPPREKLSFLLPDGVSEEDIAFTMEKHGLTREQVIERLQR